MQQHKVSVTRALSYSIPFILDHIQYFLKAYVISGIILVVAGLVGALSASFIFQSSVLEVLNFGPAAVSTLIANQALLSHMRTIDPRSIVIALILFLVYFLLFSMVTYSVIRFCFNMYYHQKNDFFPGYTHIFQSIALFILIILILIASFIATLFFIVPGVYLFIHLSLAPYILVDKGCTPWYALQRSWVLTRGHMWQVGGLWLIGFSFISFFSMLIGLPIFNMVFVHMYKQLEKIHAGDTIE
jgi:uncharacterized membrane protein